MVNYLLPMDLCVFFGNKRQTLSSNFYLFVSHFAFKTKSKRICVSLSRQGALEANQQ